MFSDFSSKLKTIFFFKFKLKISEDFCFSENFFIRLQEILVNLEIILRAQRLIFYIFIKLITIADGQ